MDRLYVSEFTQFMDRFLADHPEVVEDQRHRWPLFWERLESPGKEPEIPEGEVPFDTYESNPPARVDWVAHVIRH